jgi:hypothetical protein
MARNLTPTMPALPAHGEMDPGLSQTTANDARRGSDYAFHLYNAKGEQEDQDFLTDCNGAMDSLLVFVRIQYLQT